MTISQITAAPDENNPSTIATEIDKFISEIKVVIPQMNTDIAGTNTNATTATTQAGIATTQAGIATTQATNSANSASAAAASAVTAINAPGTSATSATSLSLGAGAKSLTIQTGKLLVPGMPVNIARTSAPTDYMYGIVTAYNSGTGALDVSVTKTNGATATYAAWTISLVGNAGTDGSDGRQYINSAATLVVGVAYYVDSSAVSFTATMPASPAVGDMVTFCDPFGTWATNPVTLARNGSLFVDATGASVAADFELNSSAVQSVTFIYTSLGWRAI